MPNFTCVNSRTICLSIAGSVVDFCADKVDGYYADVEDCSFFYQCNLASTYHMPCASGTTWDQALQTCTFTSPCVVAPLASTPGEHPASTSQSDDVIGITSTDHATPTFPWTDGPSTYIPPKGSTVYEITSRLITGRLRHSMA